jgi:hypothetical protein
MYHIGAISLKAAARHVTSPDGWVLPPKAAAREGVVTAPLPLAMWLFEPPVRAQDRYWWSAKALGVTLAKSYSYVFGVLALLGVVVFRRRFAEVPVVPVMFTCAAVLLGLLWKVGQSAGYMSERHTLLILLGGLYFAVAFVGWLGARLAGWRCPWGAAVLLAGLVVFCLPRTAARLHGQRLGFREAGAWLAANTRPGDDVYDPQAWALYHAGRLFVPQGAPRAEPEVCYIVLEQSENTHPHLYYLLDLARTLVKSGEVVYRQQTRRGAEIVIYRVPRPERDTPERTQLDAWVRVSLRPVTPGS